MAKERENPYSSFNFIVDFTTGDANTIRGAFQEVSGMNIESTVMEYRGGNSKVNHTIKINGMYKVGDVTFKRGLIGALDLYSWMHSIRTGDHTLFRTVQVMLQDEAHEGPVMSWTLTNARPMRYTVPSFNAKSGTDVAIEEIVMACDDMTAE
jgi:phage tail-like protein